MVLSTVVSLEYTGVNQIAQSGGVIAIASSTVQGGDDSFPTVDNIGPSLLFWKESSGKIQFACSCGMAMANHLARVLPNVFSHKILWDGNNPPRRN